MSAVEDNSASGTDTVECPYCAERVQARAKKCRYCGETIDVAMRKAEEALRVAATAYPRAPKSRGVAILLALLLGGVGAHKFYLGRLGWGVVYLLFCWTFIPAIIALIEAIIYLVTNEEDFHRKYG